LPITEEIKPDPISVYGFTKLEGENMALKTNPKTLIIRTAWLYSSFGNNFVKTMLRLGKEREQLGVVVDQIGTPTYAGDLAKAIMEIIKNADEMDLNKNCGLYHYSNEGVASWYDFAKAIFELKSIGINLKPLLTSEFPLPAKRPAYSLMDKSKIKNTFNLEIPYWRDSLKLCLELIDN
jgi:dTDP-4-dehydrorhamnose reductase